MPYAFIESPNRTEASGRRITTVVIHTMEIAERDNAAEICARWFANPVAEVSAHYCVDAETVIQCVLEDNIAWHARGGNASSIGIELAGFAGQRALGWDDDYSRAVARAGGEAHGRRLLADTGSRCAAFSRRPRGGAPWRHRARRRERGVPPERSLGSRARLPLGRFLRSARGSDVVESARKA